MFLYSTSENTNDGRRDGIIFSSEMGSPFKRKRKKESVRWETENKIDLPVPPQCFQGK